MATSGYQPSDTQTSNIDDTLSGTAAQSQFEREAATASDALRTRVSAAKQAARERYQQLQQGASECVAKHPGKSLAAIAIAGVAIGMLLGRRGSTRN